MTSPIHHPLAPAASSSSSSPQKQQTPQLNISSPSSSILPSPPLSPVVTPALDRDLEAFSEGAVTPAVSATDVDPLLLKSALKSEEHLNELRRRHSGKRQVAGFYTKQNAHISSLLKSMDDHIVEAKVDEDSNRTAIKIAITASFVCNCALAVLQIYAAVSSLSLSFFATAIDAIFDPLANFVLNYCHKKALTVDLRKFPSGGSKFETIGDIVYSMSMGSVSIILVAFAIQELAKGKPVDEKQLHIIPTVAVGIAFITKLVLFLYCYSLKGKSSQVHVLWEDHRNDLFINGFGIFTSAAGAKIAWWIDPMGAMIISVALILVWGRTCYGHFSFLAGKAAPLEFQQLVIYKAMIFAEEIEKIDSCVVYHAGPNYIVELDIVMASETPLWKAHDLSQSLQDKLEELPRVDRAFVHVDHEVDHKPEHRKFK